MANDPPIATACPQCTSQTCGDYRCRFTNQTHKEAYEKQAQLHPQCRECGWRKGGQDSWNGNACKCGFYEPPFGASLGTTYGGAVKDPTCPSCNPGAKGPVCTACHRFNRDAFR